MNGTCGAGIQNLGLISDQPMVKFSLAAGAVPLSIDSTSALLENAERFSQRWQAILGSMQENLGGEHGGATRTGQRDVIVPSTTSGALLENELPGRKDQGRSVGNRLAPEEVHASAGPGSPQRATPPKSLRSYFPSGPTSIRQAEQVSADESGLHLQKFCESNKSAKVQKTADSNPPDSANPKLMLSLAGAVYPVAAPTNPLQHVLSPPDVSIRTERPTGTLGRNTGAPAFNVLASKTVGEKPSVAAGSDMELELQASPVASPTDHPWLAGAGTAEDSQLVSLRPEKTIAAEFVPSPESERPVHSSSNDRQVFSSAIKSSSIASPTVDNVADRKTRTAALKGAPLKPESFQRDGFRIGETAMPLRADKTSGSPATYLNNSAAGTQTLFHAEQSSSAPAAAGVVSGTGGSSAASTEQHRASARETIATFDAGTDDIASKWVIAGGHRAEAGFQDPALGWVSVRAQASAGGIHAAVVPASDLAAQALGGHLAGLNAHMATQYEHLNPVTLSAPDTGWNNQGTGRETSHGDGGNTHHDEQQQASENPESTRAGPATRSSRVLTEAQMPGAEMPVYTPGQSQGEQHVSIVV